MSVMDGLPRWPYLVREVGFPIALVGFFLFFGVRYIEEDRSDRRAERVAFIGALQENTKAIQQLAEQVRNLEDRLLRNK